MVHVFSALLPPIVSLFSSFPYWIPSFLFPPLFPYHNHLSFIPSCIPSPLFLPPLFLCSSVSPLPYFLPIIISLSFPHVSRTLSSFLLSSFALLFLLFSSFFLFILSTLFPSLHFILHHSFLSSPLCIFPYAHFILASPLLISSLLSSLIHPLSFPLSVPFFPSHPSLFHSFSLSPLFLLSPFSTLLFHPLLFIPAPLFFPPLFPPLLYDGICARDKYYCLSKCLIVPYIIKLYLYFHVYMNYFYVKQRVK